MTSAGRNLGGIGRGIRRLIARADLALLLARRRPTFWTVVLVVALLVAALASLRFGAVDVPVRDLAPAIFDAGHPMHGVVWRIRLPRIVAACFCGAALAVSGTLLQTVVRNPLADPALMGVNAGAGVAVLVAILFFPEASLLLPLLAFLGGLAAVLAVLAFAWAGRSGAGPLRILLSGVAVQAILFSGIALLSFLYAERAPAFVSFSVGSLNGTGWREAGLVAAPVVVGIALARFAARPLDLLLLDDGSAESVGVSLRQARLGASVLAALLAAAAVSVAGLVGFVGLVIPNWVRIVTGPNHRTLLPLSALGGAALLLAADLVARTVAAPLDLPVGALMALIGGPYFLLLLWRKLP